MQSPAFWHSLSLLVFAASAAVCAASSGTGRGCVHFPFRDSYGRSNIWQLFVADVNFTTELRPLEEGARGRYLYRVELPRIWKYVTREMLVDCGEIRGAHQFRISAHFTGPTAAEKQDVNISCTYRNYDISTFITSYSFQKCVKEGPAELVGSSLYFNITRCGEYALHFTGKTSGSGDIFHSRRTKLNWSCSYPCEDNSWCFYVATKYPTRTAPIISLWVTVGLMILMFVVVACYMCFKIRRVERRLDAVRAPSYTFSRLMMRGNEAHSNSNSENLIVD